MRILLVSSSSGSRGGGELYLLYLAQALAEEGHQVALWCSRHRDMDELASQFAPVGDVLRHQYINTYQRPSRALHYLLPADHGYLARSWDEWKPDVVHLNKQCMDDGLDLLDAARRTKTPSLCTIHMTQSQSSLGAFMGKARDRVAYRFLKRFPGPLVAIGETRATELRSFLGPDAPVVCIENGVSLPSPEDRSALRLAGRRQLEVPEDALVCISVGRLEPQKRPLDFVSMAEGLHGREPRARFFWVGGGSLEEAWNAQVSAHAAESWLRCLGWKKDVRPFFAAADVYLHPAAFEGLPFALLEAMAWGLPSVIRPELARELPFLQPAEHVLLDAGDGAWMASALNPDTQRNLGVAGRKLVEQRFSRAAMARRYLDLYQRLAGKGGPA